MSKKSGSSFQQIIQTVFPEGLFPFLYLLGQFVPAFDVQPEGRVDFEYLPKLDSELGIDLPPAFQQGAQVRLLYADIFGEVFFLY